MIPMNMRKLICTALCAVTLTALTACGDSIPSGSTPAATNATNATNATSDNAAQTTTEAQAAAGEPNYVFKTASGIEIPVKAECDPIVAQLGAPKETFEAPSCAFEGKSYTYTYDGFTLETYPDGGANHVFAVTIKDATQKTPEGLTVGSDPEDVKKLCGTPEKEAPGFLRYSKDGIDVQFFREDGKVTSIVYTFRVS